jgi:hypothetical protein
VELQLFSEVLAIQVTVGEKDLYAQEPLTELPIGISDDRRT